jgi:hypothetical protein
VGSGRTSYDGEERGCTHTAAGALQQLSATNAVTRTDGLTVLPRIGVVIHNCLTVNQPSKNRPR